MTDSAPGGGRQGGGTEVLMREEDLLRRIAEQRHEIYALEVLAKGYEDSLYYEHQEVLRLRKIIDDLPVELTPHNPMEDSPF